MFICVGYEKIKIKKQNKKKMKCHPYTDCSFGVHHWPNCAMEVDRNTQSEKKEKSHCSMQCHENFSSTDRTHKIFKRSNYGKRHYLVFEIFPHAIAKKKQN